MQDMVKCVGTEDMFFDSVDHLAEFDSAVDGVWGHEFWRNEPRSVKERRDNFLREMGFVEPGSVFESDDSGTVEIRLERTVERSGVDPSSCSSSSTDYEEDEVVFCGREYNGNANWVVDEDVAEPSPSNDHSDVCRNDNSINKKIGHWWKEMMSKRRGLIGGCKCKVEKGGPQKFEMSRTKVQVNKKKFKELSALFAAQEIRAHKGIIWTMKFSPDGRYLATGGQDGVVKVWHVKTIDSSLKRFMDESRPTGDENFRREKKAKVPVVIPGEMFHIEELPVQEFHGHSGDILDLAWSNSNYLLSSSMDTTVRLWQVGSSTCLNTFYHTDFVTCVQFNPIDDRYFISGSIDGKVRVWGVSQRRVLDWADSRDAVTAVCYQPDGQGFVVGSLNGSCRFYETEGNLVELSAHILFNSKRSSTNRITGIQFCPEDSRRVVVMSEDSKLRVVDKTDVVFKYRGRPKSGSVMSASFTSNGRHIISVGEDSRVYMWNHEDPFASSSSHKKSIHSCEHFYSERVSVAVPCSGIETGPNVPGSLSTSHEATARTRDPPSFSLANLFSSSKSSATWPEDMLPVFNQPKDQSQGLVIVTASWDGIIRAYHNYGLPIRI